MSKTQRVLDDAMKILAQNAGGSLGNPNQADMNKAITECLGLLVEEVLSIKTQLGNLRDKVDMMPECECASLRDEIVGLESRIDDIE